jgi:hypothetical protein
MPKLGPRRTLILAGTVGVLATAGSALAALQALPPGGQVNDDPAAGINKAISVSGDDPTNADIAGGALTAGAANVPWAIFQQGESNAQDQVFVRSFALGAWTTRGNGTVGGLSSSSPTFMGSLNFDQTQEGRGSLDRLRRRRANGAVGDLVREHAWYQLRQRQHLRQPV